MSSPVLVIFGATVRPDGTPSPALARRLRFAVAALEIERQVIVLCSGAAGETGPSEAAVMAQTLTAAGVAAERLVLDDLSRDTLQTAVEAARLLRARGQARCLVCSDGYHLPRIQLLLAALGVRATAVARPAGLGRPSFRHLAYMSLRELAATPYDLALVLLGRGRP